MKVNTKELRTAFDVDSTLVMWPDDHFMPKEGRIRIECPYEEGAAFYLVPHKQHINYLIAKKKRGYEVTVWSQNGWAWAEQVIKTLNLEEYVDKVETKFDSYFDDLPADQWMSRVYVEHNYEEVNK